MYASRSRGCVTRMTQFHVVNGLERTQEPMRSTDNKKYWIHTGVLQFLSLSVSSWSVVSLGIVETQVVFEYIFPQKNVGESRGSKWQQKNGVSTQTSRAVVHTSRW